MARLPDPTTSLDGDDREALEQITAVRAGASGRRAPAEVYVRMFNNPGVAKAVAHLGEHLRFHGVLPDRARELAVLRFAVREQVGYEWSHHQHAARQAGIDQTVMAQLLRSGVPTGLDDPDLAVVEAVDATIGRRSMPEPVHQRLVAAFGEAGAVEVVALCGLYSLMADMVRAFEIGLEAGLPEPPF